MIISEGKVLEQRGNRLVCLGSYSDMLDKQIQAETNKVEVKDGNE
jgi:hypothetical protein